MFSIVIPTYNRPEALKRTVNSILGLGTSVDFDIVIVNDCPGCAVGEFGDGRVTVINNGLNLGRSKSRNRGAAVCKHNVLFFIDDDIEVKENMFKKHLAELENGADAVFSNVVNVRTDGKDSFLNEFLNTRGANRKNFEKNFKSNYFTTAFCSIYRPFFERIGKFDENFEGYGWEDPELGLRIEAAGGKISFLRTNSLLHYHDKDVFEWLEQLENSGANLRYLISRHPEFKKNIRYGILTSFPGAIAFNPLFVWSEKLKAKSSRGFFGYINYSFLFYAAIRRSLKKTNR
jgi:GT2 family glycosyltransferase